jgi:diacylglycerol kinase family enzyme
VARIHFLIDPIHPEIGRSWPSEQFEIEKQIQDFEIHIIRGRLHAEALTRQIAVRGAELIVCVGGDRVLHEVVNALESFEVFQRKPKVYLYPRLHRENFIRNIDSRASFFEFLADFLAGKITEERFDLVEAKFQGEYGQQIEKVFLCGTAFGLATSILPDLQEAHLSRLELIRRTWRALAFAKPQALSLQVDQETLGDAFYLTGFVQNIPQISGGLRVSPLSDPKDGKIEIHMIRRARFVRYLYLILRFYRSGIKSSSSSLSRQASSLKIEAKRKASRIPIEMDQEIRGYLPLEVRVRRKALCLLR